MIIAIEGIDGAGKNTLVRALATHLGPNVTTRAFPRYGTMYADIASDALHGHMGDLVDSAHGMALMFALDRYNHRDEITSESAGDNILILDRYVASNAAYTSARLGDMTAADWVADLEYGRFRLPTPDLTILLDTDSELAARRAQGRARVDASRQLDAYEKDATLQQRTLDAYRALAEENWRGPWLIAPPDTDPADIAARIRAHRDAGN